MWVGRTPEQNFQTALESKRGDERRDAVARIAESNYYTRDDAFQVLDTVARTDPVGQIRCIALCTLGRYEDGRPVGTFLAVLQSDAAGGTNPERRALPTNSDVRWEAARGLLCMKKRKLLEGDNDALARDLFIRLLQDSSRQVKLVAIDALGEYLDPRVLAPLIGMLRSEDFAQADHAEQSLIRLTGTTHNYDAEAWEKWVAATPDPFAHAGEKPPMTRPSGPTWFDTQIRAWRRGLKLQNSN